MLGVLRARPKTIIVLAVLSISAGLALGLAREALADYSFRCATSGCGSQQQGNLIDYDRYVPEFTGAPLNGHYDNIMGNSYLYKDFHYHRWISYDAVEMRDECANSTTWNTLYNHEHAHTRGWSHWESGYNAAYYPTFPTPCHN